MKDYKLSELKQMCREQRSTYRNCSHCPIQKDCDNYFGFSYSPSMWDIEQEITKKDVLNILEGDKNENNR